MASSNRHWPSMFKSKPNCNPHQWAHLQYHDLLSSATPPTCHRSPFASAVAGGGGGGSEERSPEPKPRWNPKPEQIRILEAIFNSGMVNPPRDEIRKIRAQLQEFGQVGDANVFYWFQNRKSRSKHKLRHIHHQNQNQNQNSSKINQQQQQQQQNKTNPNRNTTSATTTLQAAPSSSSSSSSDKSSPKGSKRTRSTISGIDHNMSVTPSYFQSPQTDFLPEPFFFPAQLQTGTGVQMTQGFCFSDQMYPSNVIQDHHAPVGPCTSLLLSEILSSSNNNNINAAAPPKNQNQEEPDKMMLKMQQQQQPLSTYTSPLAHANNICLAVPPPSHPPPTTTNINHTVTVTTSTVNHIHQGVVATGQVVDSGGGAAAGSSSSAAEARSTVVVFINDVAFEVGVGPFNVREAFGDDVLLIQSSGHPVLTNEWGVTLQSLHHGAFYYLVPLSITTTTSTTATQHI